MAKTYNNLGELFTDIANAIRNVSIHPTSMYANEFPDKISRLRDISDTTATSGTVAEGMIFYDANGNRQVGTSKFVIYLEGRGEPTGTPNIGQIYRNLNNNYIYLSTGSKWELLNSWQ